ERWPDYLEHYRSVRFRERTRDGGGLVEMAANRPFGPVQWPTWWLSQMSIQRKGATGGDEPRIRFRHVEGITAGMDVEWGSTPATFSSRSGRSGSTASDSLQWRARGWRSRTRRSTSPRKTASVSGR